MADNLRPQPIRTEFDGDVVSKICDSTTPSNQLKVESDGSINVNATLGSVTDLDIRDLVYTQDSITAHQGGSWTVTATATDLDIRDLAAAQDSVSAWLKDGSGTSITSTAGALDVNIDNASIAVTASDLDIRDLSHSQDSVKIGDGTDFLEVNGDGSLNAVVTATDLDIRDLSSATDSVEAHLAVSGNPVSASNPIPVSVVSESLGDIVIDYHTSASLAASSSINFDYTVSASKTFNLEKVIAVSGGKLKVTVQTSPDGISFTTKAVLFAAPANPMVDYHLGKDCYIPVSGTGSKVRVILLNLDNQAADVYATIHGLEL